MVNPFTNIINGYARRNSDLQAELHEFRSMCVCGKVEESDKPCLESGLERVGGGSFPVATPDSVLHVSSSSFRCLGLRLRLRLKVRDRVRLRLKVRFRDP